MAKLILASVLCIFFLVKGIEAEEVATGESCATDTSNTCKATDYCENDVCKIKVAQTCVSGSSPHNCILHAECPTSGDNLNKCTCDNDYTANTLMTVCVADAVAGESCDDKPCVSSATCVTTDATSICKANAGETCDTNTPCVSTATCDSTCKIKVAQTCVSGSSPHNCILHAECPTSGDNLNKCTCDNDYTANTLMTVCVADAVAGESCDDKPCVSSATCVTTDATSICKANAGETCDTNTPCVSTATCDSTCKVNVGATGCSANLSCVTGATCEGGTCKANAGETCDTNTPCVSTATCDSTCKVNVGATGCSADLSCVTGATCEGGTCKANAGETCDTNTSCVSTATCDSTCKVNVGATGCSANLSCVTGATCEGETCKANAEESCDTNTPCVSTATCDSTCKVNLGESCAGSLTCVTDASCTTDICKTQVTKAGDACPTLTTFCDSATLTCDGGLCKVQAGQSCAATLATQCTAHADCTEDKCVCSATDFTSNTLTGVCEGTKDKGAPCANDNCKPDLVCDGGTCKDAITTLDEDCSASVTDKACDPTTLACQQDKCKWKIEQVCTATDECVSGATCEESGTTNTQCSCPVGVSPSSDKAQCGGAMGFAASMLLVVATFVTSRFL